MSIPTTPDHENQRDETQERANDLSDEQVATLLGAAGRRKDDPEYVKRLAEGAAEYRRILEEELERELVLR